MQTLFPVKAGSLILLILLGFLVSQPASAAVDLEECWEYRWGDSPFSTEGIPEWVQGGRTGAVAGYRISIQSTGPGWA